MVTTPHYDLDIDTTLGGNDASDYIIPSQKAIKAYVDNNSGGGGSITVDQTYDSTSANAQSGVAIAGAGFVKNTATNPTGSITLLGSATSGSSAVNIGVSSTASSYCAVLGANATTGGFYSTAIGCNASTSSTNSTAVGYWATASYKYATAVGNGATASADTTVAVGTSSVANYARATSIGQSSNATADSATALGAIAKATANNAIQIGYGTNNTASTLSVGFYNNSSTHYNWQLLDGTTGLIPDARISSNIARTSDIPSVSGYLQATNGNTAYTNTGTETTMGYTDTNTGEMYGVLAGQTYYGTGVILGAQSSTGGYLTSVTVNGLGLTNGATMQTALLTVSNNKLLVNGTEVALQSDIPDISTKQDTLVSGTNIKTINNTSILGSGNIDTSEIFVADESTTTLQELEDAYNSGKTLIDALYGSIGIPQGNGFVFTSCFEKNNYKTVCDNNGWNTLVYNLADTDLSNLSSTGKTVIDGQWVDANEGIISSNTSLSGSTPLTKRITLPDDGHTYEVLIRGSIYTSSTSGKEVFLKVKGNEDSYDRYIARCITRTSSAMYSSGTTLVTASYVASNQTNLTIARESSWGGNCSELTVVAYRRIGTNT